MHGILQQFLGRPESLLDISRFCLRTWLRRRRLCMGGTAREETQKTCGSQTTANFFFFRIRQLVLLLASSSI